MPGSVAAGGWTRNAPPDHLADASNMVVLLCALQPSEGRLEKRKVADPSKVMAT
jgi:hypothetical protein